jgi:predicted Fe-Mo cluster-binding NifX family protein
MDFRNAKIAVASDDGQNVSSHFGRAPYYAVITLEKGSVVARERREKFAPHMQGEHHGDGGHQQGQHEHKHAAMVDSIRDCQVVVARGMGDGAYIHLTSAGLTTILTHLHTVEEVAQAAAQGALEHQDKRLHHHGHSPL